MEAALIRTRNLRAEHWREAPVPAKVAGALEFAHTLRSTRATASGEAHWRWSRATAHRKITKTMADAGIEGPQASPNGHRHGFGIAAVAASVLLPAITAVLGHADTATTAVGVERNL